MRRRIEQGGLLLVAAALLLALLILSLRTNLSTVLGCGTGSSCDDVMAGPWGRILGVSVLLPGCGIYACFLFAAWRWRNVEVKLLDGLATVIVGSALWFVAVQAIILKVLCPICLTIHTLAALGTLAVMISRTDATRPAPPKWPARVIGLALVTLFVCVQALSPAAPDYMTFRLPDESSMKVVHEEGTTKLMFHGGKFMLDCSHVPRMGRADAQEWLAFFFTYACPHCREAHESLRKLVDTNRHLGVILIPIPLERECNAHVELTRRRHEHTCQYSRLAYALAKHDPKSFAAFDQWLAQTDPLPPPEQVSERVASLCPDLAPGVLPNTTESLEVGIQIWAANCKLTGQTELPQFQSVKKVTIGNPRSDHLF